MGKILYAYGPRATTNLYLQDYEGLKQFSYAFGSTLLNHLHPKVYHQQRKRTIPTATETSLFPTGHTSALILSRLVYSLGRYGWNEKLSPHYLVASLMWATHESGQKDIISPMCYVRRLFVRHGYHLGISP